MSEPEISPLARRLAEENNVEWRALRGSGGAGKVVERDVLEYLARVMAGDEDLDPTPEPLPSGMQAWPEDDVASFRQERGASSQSSGLDDIQRQLSASQRSADTVSDPPQRFTDSALSTDTSNLDDISEDIFLFDDDDDMLVADGVVDDAVVAEDADDRDDAVVAEGAFIAAVVPEDDLDDDMLVADEGDDEDVEIDERAIDDVGLWSDGAAAAAEEDSSPDIFGEPTVSADVQDEASLELFADASSESAERSDDALEIPSEDELAMDFMSEPAEPVRPVAASTDPVPSDLRPTDAWSADDTLGEHVPTANNESWGTPQVEPEPVSSVTGPAALANDMPLVSYGSLLRRHLDLSSLTGAQLAVSQEFGLDEPLPPTAFLLRAAAKALAEEGEGGRPLLLACFTAAGMRLSNLSEAATGPFRALHDAVSRAAGEVSADGAALVVADMSGLEIDEAVLNLGAPVLTLGRILYDNQRGSYKSTLTMSGDVAPERGARLLAKVAELLDSPVRLVL